MNLAGQWIAKPLPASLPPYASTLFENYIRGIIAGSNAEKIAHFREAVRLNPAYNEAWLHLGKTYFENRQYDPAIAALSHVPPTDAGAGEANFFLGVSAYNVGDFSRAQSAFNFVALRLPLPQVYSNLGAVASRLGNQKEAAENFQKAVQSDSNDADYRFNLALVLAQAGERTEAERQLKECLSLSPTDTEARAFLDSLPDSSRTGQTSQPRIKANYDEDSFRQLAVGMQSAAEERLAKTIRRPTLCSTWGVVRNCSSRVSLARPKSNSGRPWHSMPATPKRMPAWRVRWKLTTISPPPARRQKRL